MIAGLTKAWLGNLGELSAYHTHPYMISYGILTATDLLAWGKTVSAPGGCFYINPSVTTDNLPELQWYAGRIEVSQDNARYLELFGNNGAFYQTMLVSGEWSTWVKGYNTASSHNHAAGDITSGTLGTARGGTGITSNPSMLVNLGSTSAASVFATSPRPGVTGTLPVARGGTGVTTLDALKTALSLPSSILKLQTGTFTGRSGISSYASRENTLTFDITPYVVMLGVSTSTASGGGYYTYHGFFVRPATKAEVYYASSNEFSTDTLSLSWGTSTLVLSTTVSSPEQELFAYTGTTYWYAAFGY